MEINLYDKTFFEHQQEGSSRSARKVVPLLLEVLNVKSVCDVGCGLGIWLDVFGSNGVESLCGIDGDYIDSRSLKIRPDQFVVSDLKNPIKLDRKFDLVISLEVAEHLPAEISERFVDDLVRLAPVVLFSAAIPKQGGTGHINEKWQNEWAELFERNDYVPIDFIRPQIWYDDDVEYWYAQNTILYCERKLLNNNFKLKELHNRTKDSMLAVVHPRQLEASIWRFGTRFPRDVHLSQVLKALPELSRRAIVKRLSGR